MLGTIGFISFIGFSLGFLRVRLVVGVPVSRHVGVWGVGRIETAQNQTDRQC
jgi:uncharacterized membrane protein